MNDNKNNVCGFFLTTKQIFGLFAGLEKAELLCLAFAAVSI